MSEEDEFGLNAMNAIRNHDLEEIRYWILAGAKPGRIYSNGKTLLGTVAEHGDFHTFKQLLIFQEFCAMLKLEDLQKYVALKDGCGKDVFSYAFLSGQNDIVKYLLGRFPKLYNPNSHNYFTTSLLEQAVRLGFAELLNILLDKKANIDAENQDKQTALIVAAKLGKTELLQILVERGAQLNVVDVNNYTALCYATSIKNEEACKILIEAGIDYELGKIDSNFTVMEKVFWNKMSETLRLLFKHGGKFSDLSSYFVMVVGPYKDLEMVKLLHEAGADINRPDSNNKTPLQISIKLNGRDHEITKYLLKHGAKK